MDFFSNRYQSKKALREIELLQIQVVQKSGGFFLEIHKYSVDELLNRHFALQNVTYL
jgi:hypothetical protein